MSLVVNRALDAAWLPTSQQAMEADTTFLLDPAGDTTLGLTSAFGGLLQAGTSASVVAGKFLQGYNPASSSNSYVWMPMEGLLNPDEWTIEFWVQATADWSTLAGSTFLTVGGPNNLIDFSVPSSTSFRLRVSHVQNPASPSSYVASCSQTIANGTYPANTWVEVAATMAHGAMTLYANGSVVASTTGVVNPALWASKSHNDGIWLPCSNGGASPTAVTVSDLRFSRRARNIGSKSIIAVERSVITVKNAATGGTVQPLTGHLHSLPNPTADATQASLQAIHTARMDKWMTATPIVAGGIDATHPTAGHSGSFSYDWQIADRTADYLVNTIKTEPYISIGGNSQITGGATGPFTNTVFTTSGAQQPDVSGTMLFTSATGALISNDYFGYSGNVYRYQGRSGNSLTGVVLVSGTAGLTIPNGASVNVGKLTVGYAWQTTYDASVPSSLTNHATFWADLAYHLVNENNGITGVPLPTKPTYFGVGNEPDGGASFWAGTQPQYLLWYQACASAIKGVSASLKIGGPEIADWSGKKTWVQALINFCGTLPAPTGVTAAAQAGGGSFNGSTTLFIKAVYRNASGNSVGSNEVSATPALNGSILVTLPYQPGATTIDLYGATSSGGQTGATSLITTGITAGNQVSTTFTVTSATLTSGAIPASATASGIALDFISSHFYSGDLSEFAQMRYQVDAWCTAAGLATGLPFINGEWSWNSSNYASPWQQTGGTPIDHIRNDWSAAFMAAAYVMMQNFNAVRSISCDFLGGAPASNAGTWHYTNADHYFDLADGHNLAPYNVAQLWAKIAGNAVYGCSGPQTVACDPGIFASFSKDGGGKYYLLIANLHYRKVKRDGTAKNAPVLVTGIPVADGTTVTAYVVDDQHSNAYDAGTANASLQTVSTALGAQGVNKVANGQVGITLRPRATALLIIG